MLWNKFSFFKVQTGHLLYTSYLLIGMLTQLSYVLQYLPLRQHILAVGNCVPGWSWLLRMHIFNAAANSIIHTVEHQLVLTPVFWSLAEICLKWLKKNSVNLVIISEKSYWILLKASFNTCMGQMTKMSQGKKAGSHISLTKLKNVMISLSVFEEWNLRALKLIIITEKTSHAEICILFFFKTAIDMHITGIKE